MQVLSLEINTDGEIGVDMVQSVNSSGKIKLGLLIVFIPNKNYKPLQTNRPKTAKRKLNSVLKD